MEENKNTEQSHHHTEPNPAKNSASDPSDYPPSSAGKKPDRENSGEVRETKRRRNCPAALDDLSFSFDTKFTGTVAEITPKFGSFNSVSLSKEEEDGCLKDLKIRKGKEEEQAENLRCPDGNKGVD